VRKPNQSKPVGHAIRWTAADVARLADITAEDVAAAKAQVVRLAPKRVRAMLDAKRKG
jgi:hypothetical protein